MRVGIFTFHRAHNYGAMLQTYALKNVCEKMGADIWVVDYPQLYITKQYCYFSFTKGIKNTLLNMRNICGNICKNVRFKSFMNAYLSLTPYHTDNKNIPFDVLLYGSDQIWNPDISRSFDEVFFGYHNLISNKHIAYAASFGRSYLSEGEKERFMSLSGNLSAISVREISAVEMIQPLVNIDVHVTLDPTLLLSRDEWSTIAISPNMHDKYLLVYEITRYPETMELAKKIAKELNLQIVELTYVKTKLRYNHICINSAGPREFLGWFRNAEYIVTNSFHGTAFSIINRKNFYTIPHKSVGSRMIDLLETLGLSDRLVENPDEVISFDSIDYGAVDPKLEKEIEVSKDFLKRAFND